MVGSRSRVSASVQVNLGGESKNPVDHGLVLGAVRGSLEILRGKLLTPMPSSPASSLSASRICQKAFSASVSFQCHGRGR